GDPFSCLGLPTREGHRATVDLPSGTPGFASERSSDPRSALTGGTGGPDPLVELRIVDLPLFGRRAGDHDGDLTAEPLHPADAPGEVTERAAQQLLVLLGEFARDRRSPTAEGGRARRKEGREPSRGLEEDERAR